MTGEADAPSLPIMDDITENLSVAMSQAMQGKLPPNISPEQIIDALAARIAEKAHNGDGGKPPRRFMGLASGDWFKFVVGMLAAAGLFLITWYQTVNLGLRERPTFEQLHATFQEHGQTTHPATDARINQIEKSLVRQEGIDREQTNLLIEVRDDVRAIRRAR